MPNDLVQRPLIRAEDDNPKVRAKKNMIERCPFGFNNSLPNYQIQPRNSNEALFAGLMNDTRSQDAVGGAPLPIGSKLQQTRENAQMVIAGPGSGGHQGR